MVIRGKNYRKIICWECGEPHNQQYFTWYQGIKYCKECYRKLQEELEGWSLGVRTIVVGGTK